MSAGSGAGNNGTLVGRIVDESVKYYPHYTFKAVEKADMGATMFDFMRGGAADLTKFLMAIGVGTTGLAWIEHYMLKGLKNNGATKKISESIVDMVGQFSPKTAGIEPDGSVDPHKREHAVDMTAEILWNGVSFWSFLAFYEMGGRLAKLISGKKLNEDHSHDAKKDEHGKDPDASHTSQFAKEFEKAEKKEKPKGIIQQVGDSVRGASRFLFRDCLGALMGSVPDILLSYWAIDEQRDVVVDLKEARTRIDNNLLTLDTLIQNVQQGSRYLSVDALTYLNSELHLGVSIDARQANNPAYLAQQTAKVYQGMRQQISGANEQLEQTLLRINQRAEQDSSARVTQQDSEDIARINGTLRGVGEVLRSFTNPGNQLYDGTSFGVVAHERAAAANAANADAKLNHEENGKALSVLSNQLKGITGTIGRAKFDEKTGEGVKLRGNLRGISETLEKVGVPRHVADYFSLATIAFVPFNVVRSSWYDIYDRLFPKDQAQKQEFAETPAGEQVKTWGRNMSIHAATVTLGAVGMAYAASNVTKSLNEGRLDEFAHQISENPIAKTLGINEDTARRSLYRISQFGGYMPLRMGGINASPMGH